ncbi:MULTISPECIES: Hsp20/alpha crystallin family protein [Sphingobacterium]|uniref:Hsp20/alpha crystallin family protein n=1 Tax=Sphingobacterium TaxID=28453 RepID=UPI0013DD785F|nr:MULTISPECIES: Hsp20/alpha crystallin family protein [unclassified Sphingobacterium]
MSLSLRKKNNLPSLMSDWLNPVPSIFDRDFFDVDFGFFNKRIGLNVPSVNISENQKDYVFEVAAPGLSREDFKLQVENHILCISAEKTEEASEEKNGYTRQEYSFNTFQRTFSLPEHVKENEINARYEDGILKITVPKSEETTVKPSHTIPVL